MIGKLENIENVMSRISEIQKKIASFQRSTVAPSTFQQTLGRPETEQISKTIDKTADKFNLDKNLIRSVIDVESGFNPKAVSDKGARGLMQLMPETAQNMGVDDVEDVEDNIQGGTKYLSQLLGKYGNDLELSLAAYNAGPEAVDRSGRKVPDYAETKDYVKKVMEKYRQYQELK